MLIFAVTLSGVMVWHWRDQRVPQDDSANLACTALEIRQKWDEQGVVKGIKALYRHSGWRPILLPNLTAVLTFAFRGNVVQAASAAMLLSWGALYGFTYLCFRLHLGQVSSALCASFLATLPGYFVYSCFFYAELPMLACLVAAVYHAKLLHAGNCQSVQHGTCLGLWIALALAMRPLEPIPVAGLMFLGLTVSSLRVKTLSWRDLALAAAPVLITALVLFLRARSVQPGGWAPVVLVLSTGVYLTAVKRAGSRMNIAFAASVAAALLATGLWYAPRMHGLCDWVWQCTVGDMIQLYKGRGSMSPSAAIAMYLQGLGGWQLLSVGLVSAAVLVVGFRRRPMAGGYFMAIGAAQVVLVLILTTLMAGSDVRRGLVGFYHLFIGLTVFSIAGGAARLAWLRILPVAGFAAIQTALLWSASMGRPLPAAGQVISRHVGWYVAASPREDENRQVFRQVQEGIPHGNAICCLSLAVYAFDARAFCPHALNLLALENHADLRFGYPWNFRDLDEGYRRLEAEGYRFVLLDTRDAPPGIPEHNLQEPTSRLAADVVRRSREGSLAEVGWKEVNGFREGEAKTIVLAQHPRP